MIKLENYKAGHLEPPIDYQYFVPNKIFENWTWESTEINNALEKAAVKLGELNSFSKLVPNVGLFIQMHINKEAVISSRIEGTQTNIGEALLPEGEIVPERRNDWKEVTNYINALNAAIDLLDELPLSSRLFRRTYKILMKNVRGESKQPGEFRTSQNWIGGSNPSNAKFVPPQHHLVNELMGDLEKFLFDKKSKIPLLIKIAIAHYQFETIHPFLDGNGRIGRLLITLFLVNENILEQPLLYLSSFFEKNKADYYDYLTFVRERNDMKSWILFFLDGIEKTANQSVETLSNVIKLKERYEKEIRNSFGTRTNFGLVILNQLLEKPVITIGSAAEKLNVTFRTASFLIREFENREWLKEISGRSRNQIFVMEDYLRLYD